MRISRQTLNRIITSEIKSVLRESSQPRRRSLASLIFEEDAKAQSSTQEKPKKVYAAADSITGKTNIADVNPDVIYDMLTSGDASLKLWSEIEKESGNKLDPAKTAEFWKKMPKETFVQRWTSMAGKLPETGLPKSEMPFLPGPPDATGTVEELEDILTPGGNYSVDFESVSRKGPALTEVAVFRRWGKLAGIISEKMSPENIPKPDALTKGTPEAEKYLKSGIEDGNDQDDSISFEKNGKIKVSAAVPTQKNVNIGKTIAFATSKEAGGRGVKAGPLGAYGSKNNEILDGHHRWSALAMTEPEGEFETFMKIDLDALGGGKKELGLKHLTAIGNALGNKQKT